MAGKQNLSVLMRKQAKSRKTITDPFCKYETSKEFVASCECRVCRVDSRGTLTCKLCHVLVKSEPLWKVHCANKQHRKNLAALRAQADTQKKRKMSESKSFEKVESSDTQPPASKPRVSRGTAKQGFDASLGSFVSLPTEIQHQRVQPSSAIPATPTTLPRQPTDGAASSSNTSPAEGRAEDEDAGPIPIGFFDDKKKDAAAHGIDLVKLEREQLEAEMARFQATIRPDLAKAQEIQREEEKADFAANERREEAEDRFLRERLNELRAQRAQLEKRVANDAGAPTANMHTDSKRNGSGSETDSDEDEDEEVLDSLLSGDSWRVKEV